VRYCRFKVLHTYEEAGTQAGTILQIIAVTLNLQYLTLIPGTLPRLKFDFLVLDGAVYSMQTSIQDHKLKGTFVRPSISLLFQERNGSYKSSL
jgi:hypothetical protein